MHIKMAKPKMDGADISIYQAFYAVVTSEANVQWWVIRTNLFKSGDNNVFADKAAQKATRKM